MFSFLGFENAKASDVLKYILVCACTHQSRVERALDPTAPAADGALLLMPSWTQDWVLQAPRQLHYSRVPGVPDSRLNLLHDSVLFLSMKSGQMRVSLVCSIRRKTVHMCVCLRM